MFECQSSDRCFYLNVVILLVLANSIVDTQQRKLPASEFSQYRRVQPTLHHARTKREISTTRHTNGIHHREVTVTLPVDSKDYVLDLNLNEDLVTGDHVISYQKNGTTILHKPTKEELNICQYSGTVRGQIGSWAAVSTCHGVRGIIYDGQKMLYIEPTQGNSINSEHYLYDHSDLARVFPYGYSSNVTDNVLYDPSLMKKYRDEDWARSRIGRHKRSIEENAEIRGPFNENKLTRYVELVLVADNRVYNANGGSLENVHRNLKDVANIINSVYAPLNISIALVGVVVWTERDEIELKEDGDKTLTNFLTYRKKILIPEIPHDNAQLLTQQKFNDGVVGKSLVGTICSYQFSGGVSTNYSNIIGLVSTSVAHSLGHNFGMQHDSVEGCECPDEKCIMDPSVTSVAPTHWSSCSRESLALAFERGMDYCLRNKPKRLFDSPTCGNGFVEAGEQCDCGLKPSAACRACCDPRSCLLRPNATCGAGQCCDPQTCQPMAAGTVCRAADSECDLPEYCSGSSEFCPNNGFKMDATPCANNQAYCVQGSCRTHTDQCRLLWGSTGETADSRCYDSNVKGNRYGNCGYTPGENPAYTPCSPEDAMCGRLQCRHLSEGLEFGMESTSILSAAFIYDNGTIISCRSATMDFGLNDVDPGLVPDGAKCGENKMCLHQRCVSVASVIASLRPEIPDGPPYSNCSGHGVYNSEGHFDCERGFAPPLRTSPDAGGSNYSGPPLNTPDEILPKSTNQSVSQVESVRCSVDLTKSLNDSKENKNTTEMDEIDLFFLNMSKAVKALPKLEQIKIKLDLHTAISQAEIRQLQDKRN